MTISLEMSMKKLVRLTAHTFRGSDFSLLFECLTAGSVSPIPDNLSRNSPKKSMSDSITISSPNDLEGEP